MEDISGTKVQVILSIKEGNGFGQVDSSTIIIATLNGHALETDIIAPSLHPQYATDLVWDADKTSVRKMRVGHVPLKLECYAVSNDGTKEKIGYVLLPLRSAQIIPKGNGSSVKIAWHKLLGVKSDLRVSGPELLLSLTIEERENIDSQAASFGVKTGIDTDTEFNFSTGGAVPRLLRDERLIQLGPDSSCREIFLLSVTAGRAENLEYLIKKDFKETSEDFSFWYQILENNIELKSFKKVPEKTHILDEKIVIRIRSSLKVLNMYFQENPYLIVKLRYADVIAGQSKIDLRPLLPRENIDSVFKNANDSTTALDQQCYLSTDETTGEDKRPSIDIQLRLQYVGLKDAYSTNASKLQMSNVTTNTGNIDAASKLFSNSCNPFANFDPQDAQESHHTMNKKTSEIDAHRNPGGDFGKSVNLDHSISCHMNRNKQFSSCEILKEQIPDLMFSHSADAILHSTNDKEYSKSIEAYRCYCLSVSLESVEFSQRLNAQNINFCFHHPKAQIMSTLHSKISGLSTKKLTLQDIQCKLHFISSADEIAKLLVSFPPRVSICDAEDNPNFCLAQAVLDVRELFNQIKPECKFEVPLMDCDQNEVGILDVTMVLEDCGPYYRSKRRKSAEDLGPPILDDSLAYKIVEELETWKERQQEIFRVELKRKEEKHLNSLSEEWHKRRQALEAKLACSVEQCKMLANSLNNATEDLRIRRLKSLEKEARLIKANEDLQWRYDHKLQELREASQRLEDDLNHKLSIIEEERNVLVSKVEPLEFENNKLRKIVNQQTEELEVYKKGYLTQDQTAALLQDLKGLEEKLNNAQKSKSFFKEQWGKAVREIHRMKMEHQQAVQVHINNSKEELKNIDLEGVLRTDSRELLNDQILLGEIQKEINVIKPRPSFMQVDMDEEMYVRPTNLYSKSSHSMARSEMSVRSEEVDERLKNLIEERDSLLKTGSYSIDDAVIMKLNTEIRSLLITS